MDKYKIIEKLGKGSYGVVYKAQNKITGRIVALKKIPLENDDEGIPCTALREVSSLKSLKHPNIVTLLDILRTEKKLTLIFEFLDYDLKKYIDSYFSSLTFPIIKNLMHQLFSAVYYCHQKKIMHRDLKPQNLLVNANENALELKLGDFGLSRCFSIPSRNYSNEVVTLWYRAPDILLGSTSYEFSIDIWSVGCIFAELFIGKPLFAGTSQKDQLEKIFKILGTPNPFIWPSIVELPQYKNLEMIINYPRQDLCQVLPEIDQYGIDLLKKCLEYCPEKRITAQQALLHPYFSQYHLSRF